MGLTDYLQKLLFPVAVLPGTSLSSYSVAINDSQTNKYRFGRWLYKALSYYGGRPAAAIGVYWNYWLFLKRVYYYYYFLETSDFFLPK